MPIDPAFLRTIADGGGLVLFITFVVIAAIGLRRQWWVEGGFYHEMRRERDEALKELRTAHKTIDRLTVQLARERRRRATDHDPS